MLRHPPWRSTLPRPVPPTINPLRHRLARRLLRRLNKKAGFRGRLRNRFWKAGSGGWPFVPYDNKTHYFSRELARESACGRWNIQGDGFETIDEGLARLTCRDCKANNTYQSELQAEDVWRKGKEWRLRSRGELPPAPRHWTS
jgi:hypothetical protein